MREYVIGVTVVYVVRHHLCHMSHREWPFPNSSPSIASIFGRRIPEDRASLSSVLCGIQVKPSLKQLPSLEASMDEGKEPDKALSGFARVKRPSLALSDQLVKVNEPFPSRVIEVVKQSSHYRLTGGAPSTT